MGVRCSGVPAAGIWVLRAAELGLEKLGVGTVTETGAVLVPEVEFPEAGESAGRC